MLTYLSPRRRRGAVIALITGAAAVTAALSLPALSDDFRKPIVILEHPLANTNTGRIRGNVSEDGRLLIYKGIPYAAPPVGQLRWKPPQPAAPWSGIRDAW